jgi:hypothetical protein
MRMRGLFITVHDLMTLSESAQSCVTDEKSKVFRNHAGENIIFDVHHIVFYLFFSFLMFYLDGRSVSV